MSRLRIALTFDAEHPDRPATAGNAEALVARLAAHGVRATFFVQGRWAEAYPGTVREIVAGGHLVGSHSHYHARMPLLTDAGIAADLAAAAAAIEHAGGGDPRPWFRCPFGAGSADGRVLAAIERAGYRHVGWHVAVDDWEPACDPATVAREVVAGLLEHGDDAVGLLHTWPSATLAAIDPILADLGASGAELCRIDELAEIPGSVPW